MCGALLVPYSLGSPYANVVLQKKTSVVVFFFMVGVCQTPVIIIMKVKAVISVTAPVGDLQIHG